MKTRAGLVFGAPRSARPAVPAILAVLLTLTSTMKVSALTESELKQIKFDQKIGAHISRDLNFRAADGSEFRFDAGLGGKPSLLVLGYYHCPMLCTLINDGLINALQQLRLNVGRDFNIIDVSIDPRETPALAAGKKIQY